MMNCILLLPLVAALFALAHAQIVLPDQGERCDLKCPPGHFIDVQSCVCVSFTDYTPPTHPSPYSTTTQGVNPDPTCPLVRCPLTFVPCAEYRLDAKGCQTCQCKCLDFGRNCPTDCKYGTKWIKDENDCKVCSCAAKPEPSPKPWPKKCPPVCMIYCPYGNVLDADGCPTCACEGEFPW